jgi:predicted SAM-dependent methyltransferase
MKVLNPLRTLKVAFWRLRSTAGLKNAVRTIPDNGLCKLQLGAAGNLLPGWINTDYERGTAPTYFMDAAATFPIGDGLVDYVFSEHMIEHISYPAGNRMLAECFRVMKPGGAIRLATPDLFRIVSLYFPNGPEYEAYEEWAIKFNGLPVNPTPECHIINHFVRAWGHTFIYDEPTLRASIVRAGFVDVSRFPMGHSDDTQLRGLEHHGKVIGEQPNDFETMVLQARKPLD